MVNSQALDLALGPQPKSLPQSYSGVLIKAIILTCFCINVIMYCIRQTVYFAILQTLGLNYLHMCQPVLLVLSITCLLLSYVLIVSDSKKLLL